VRVVRVAVCVSVAVVGIRVYIMSQNAYGPSTPTAQGGELGCDARRAVVGEKNATRARVRFGGGPYGEGTFQRRALLQG